jgi:hypothetical protein
MATRSGTFEKEIYMLFSEVADKQVCQFIGLYADKTVEFGWRMSYRVIVYAAERVAGGAICPEFNGVAVLRPNPDAANNPGSQTWFLTKYRMAQADSGHYGMTVSQALLFDRLCASASLSEFLDILTEERAPAALCS